MIVLDDFIQRDEQLALLNAVSSAKFPWYWQPDIDDISRWNNHKNIYSPPQFVHEFISPTKYEKIGASDVVHYDNHELKFKQTIDNLLVNLQQKMKYKTILRAKINLVNKINIDSDYHHPPHVDFLIPHWVLIYYVCDSDGDTVFFKKAQPNREIVEECRIKPKMGRAVIFDGSWYHASSSPIEHDRRLVVNIDFTT